MQTHELKPLVSCVLEGGDAGALLVALMRLDREDIYGQSAIRFLMLQDKWNFTPKNEHDDAIGHLFGAFPERREQKSEDYIKATHDIILELWGVEVEGPKWLVNPPVVNQRSQGKQAEGGAKKTARTHKTKPVITGGQLPCSDSNLDGASDRLKKVIKIQRGV
jgi:hypothetical protein